MLNIQSPGLFLGRLIQIANGILLIACPNIVDAPGSMPIGCLDSKWKRIAQKFERQPGLRRDVVHPVRYRIVTEEAAADGVADHTDVGRIVVHSVAAANDCCGAAACKRNRISVQLRPSRC